MTIAEWYAKKKREDTQADGGATEETTMEAVGPPEEKEDTQADGGAKDDSSSASATTKRLAPRHSEASTLTLGLDDDKDTQAEERAKDETLEAEGPLDEKKDTQAEERAKDDETRAATRSKSCEDSLR